MGKLANKKGLSEVVTYVLLIVTALGLSLIVFTFLQNILPSEQETCPEGLSLTIKEVVKCEGNSIKVSFGNKGRFEIDGVYARYSNTADQVASRPLMALGGGTSGNEGLNDITIAEKNKGFFYFGRLYYPIPLKPGIDYDQHFDYTESIARIEMQPFINDEDGRELVICEDKVVTREIPIDPIPCD